MATASAFIELSAKGVILLTIDGVVTTLDVREDTGTKDMDEDMASIAGTIGWYTQVLAAAREHCDLTEARYRAWQSATLREFIIDEPRIAEWKAKAALNSEPAFLSHKVKQAAAWKLVNKLSGAIKALEVKADMLRSRGAMVRTEIRHLDRSMLDESVEAKSERLKEHLDGT